MPELPEVETVVRGLRRVVMGAKFGPVRYASMRVSRSNRRGWKAARHSFLPCGWPGAIWSALWRRGNGAPCRVSCWPMCQFLLVGLIQIGEVQARSCITGE